MRVRGGRANKKYEKKKKLYELEVKIKYNK